MVRQQIRSSTGRVELLARRRRGLGAALVVLGWACWGCTGELAVDRPIEITQDVSPGAVKKVRIRRPSDEGAYVISTDGVVVDFGGAVIVGGTPDQTPDQFVGRGIVVRGARDVTIKNARIRGFKIAIYAEDSPGLTIENCDVSDNYRQRLKSTPEKEDESDWLFGHENDDHQWLRFGAGIYLLRCDGATIRNCRARDGQNGLCLVRCNEAKVRGCDFSFMSGWGLAMWRSNRCAVIGNRFDYCVRGYSHGVYARGQDSTGILVYEQCSDNVFAYNHATHGGDGFFLYAGHETVNQTGTGGCNRNVLYENDFSHAVANGIEATFSDQNVFMNNRLDDCTHGVWAGYSRRTLIVNNRMEGCASGVSIEHGQNNRIIWNRLKNCGKGLWLWWDDDKELLASAYGKQTGGASENEWTERNTFEDCKLGILADASTGLIINGSTFEGCETNVKLQNAAAVRGFVGNMFDGGTIANESSVGLSGWGNFLSPKTVVEGPSNLTQPAPYREAARQNIHNGPEYRQADDPAPWPWAWAREMGIPAAGRTPPPLRPKARLRPLDDLPEGKAHMVIDAWGPVHPRRRGR